MFIIYQNWIFASDCNLQIGYLQITKIEKAFDKTRNMEPHDSETFRNIVEHRIIMIIMKKLN